MGEKNQKSQDFVSEQEDMEESAEMDENEMNGQEVTAEDQIATLQQELDEAHDKVLRIAAESENFKKRIEKERENILKYAGENILRELLNTLDNLERALEQGTNDTEDSEKKLTGLIEGVELTQKALLSTLEKFEVSQLSCIGEEFDPNLQEALTMEPSDEVPTNHVLREFVKGYMFKDRLLRPAKVIVSGGSS